MNKTLDISHRTTKCNDVGKKLSFMSAELGDSVSSRPQRPGEIEMFRGEGVWGRSKGWGTAPRPPEKFLKFSNKY